MRPGPSRDCFFQARASCLANVGVVQKESKRLQRSAGFRNLFLPNCPASMAESLGSFFREFLGVAVLSHRTGNGR